MFRIGEFSKLSQVSVKTLRYYDEIGLLRPDRVDEFTGYRYYSAGQLPRLHRILALKELGLSLEQVADLLKGDLSPAEIRGILKLRQAEIQERLREEQERLGRVEALLGQMEKEGKMPKYEVVLKRLEPQRVAALRDTVPAYGEVGRLFGELFGGLGRAGLRPAGPPLAIYHDPEYRERDVDVEAAVPVVGSAPGDGRVAVRSLPEVETAACLVHQGPYEGFSQAYGALMAWVEASGYRIAGPNREVYLHGPGMGSGPESYVTEIQLPVEKA